LKELDSTLESLNRTDISLIDSPVSGGTIRAAQGKLTILSSGTDKALQQANKILSLLSEKLYIIPGGVGAASNVKMINQLLAGIHIAAAAEAMGLAAKAGLDTRQVYDIILTAAGNSWMFENRVPHMLGNDLTPYSALDIFVKDMGIVTSSGRLNGFPLPLSSAAEQLYINASSQGFGRQDDSGLVRIYNPSNPTLVHDQARSASALAEELTPVTTPPEISKVGFVGLGAMGVGMASSLVNAGFKVCGYDVYEPSIQKFLAVGAGATSVNSPAEAAQGTGILTLMVQNAAQVDDVLFGAGKAAATLPDSAIIILNSTVSPSFVRDVQTRLDLLGKNLKLIDAPVSGGVVRAATGELTIVSSGDSIALAKAHPVLKAMSGPAKNLHRIQGGVGAASSVKLINQLLASVHIAAAAEAMAFGAKLGLDTQRLYDIIKNAAGGSWMFENRVPAMLTADWTPHSQLAIFVKDLGIILDEGKRLLYSTPLSAAAHQLYLMGASNGWSKEADGGVVRVWETMTGVSVSKSTKSNPPPPSTKFQPREYPKIPVKETLTALQPVYTGDVLSTIRSRINDEKTPLLIALDDDPTGTQTCHNIPVLTVWDHTTLCTELRASKSGVFILTNSRALPGPEARTLISTICNSLSIAAKETGRTFQIVLRGDSTLRGHFPDEPEAVESVLGESDAWILAPFFFQGGRYTIDDIHYVAEKDVLVPASQTPFAADAAFGYASSNLRDYVLEKASGRFTEKDLFSITLSDIRLGGPAVVTKRLLEAPKHSVIIVNAADESDMFVFAAGVIAAEQAGKRYLYRTGAAFVSARLGISGIAPLTSRDLDMHYGANMAGGLIVAGSYVPKTTAQLASLRDRRGDKLHVIELDVATLIKSDVAAAELIGNTIQDASDKLKKGEDVLVMTSRKLIVGADAISSLNIGGIVAAALVRIVQSIDVRPRYVIAKVFPPPPFPLSSF
jgi:3-hydroxyisobutyrate dehydrogenase-like beta-hydroxyacid dehydrogenase/uncharacterized protein YgbK (DUF1537 family)